MFAKLFDTPHGQLLVTKEFEDDQYQVAIRGVGNSFCTPTMSFTYETEEARDAVFDKVEQADADKQAAEIAGVVASMFKDAEK